MAVTIDDEIMLEVRKLNRLIAECCPEVFDARHQHEAATLELRHETEILSRHRQRILTQAVDTKQIN